MIPPLISDIDIFLVKKELIKPYELSFATYDFYDSIRVKIILNNGDFRESEVVPQVGYVNDQEDLHFIQRNLKEISKKIISLNLIEARSKVKIERECIYTFSALLSAIDLFEFGSVDTTFGNLKFVLAATAGDPSFTESVETSIKENRTLKVKLTGKRVTDIEFLNKLLPFKNKFSKKIRLDANQSYDCNSAIALYEHIISCNLDEMIDYVEQPLKIDDWESLKLLVGNYGEKVPTMLDESIQIEADIFKAHKYSIKFVKLKLFKQGGIKELISLSKKANELGMKVVMGNGVATEVGNNIENSVFQRYSKYYHGDSEGNGFLKLK